ncbi:MAG: hypothetical protein JWQ97_4069 [Phenylobacterium sp.]|nr:hypothetical protein [Phenylobacterium sp.]
MSETPDQGAPAAAPAPPSNDRLSTQAIVTYVLLLQFNLVGAGIFALILAKVDVSPVMLGVLGGLITAVTASVSGATGYWLGSSAGSKASAAALAQIAAS